MVSEFFRSQKTIPGDEGLECMGRESVEEAERERERERERGEREREREREKETY